MISVLSEFFVLHPHTDLFDAVMMLWSESTGPCSPAVIDTFRSFLDF